MMGGMIDDDDLPFAAEEMLETIEAVHMTPLSVHVDVVDLLDHFTGDEARVFDFVGKLKDLLT